jgi:hypothetical protein
MKKIDSRGGPPPALSKVLNDAARSGKQVGAPVLTKLLKHLDPEKLTKHEVKQLRDAFEHVRLTPKARTLAEKLLDHGGLHKIRADQPVGPVKPPVVKVMADQPVGPVKPPVVKIAADQPVGPVKPPVVKVMADQPVGPVKPPVVKIAADQPIGPVKPPLVKVMADQPVSPKPPVKINPQIVKVKADQPL